MTEAQDKAKGSDDLAVQRYRPLSMFKAFDNFFDRMDKWFEPFSIEPFGEESFRMPLTNIKEHNDAFSIETELPGLDKGDLEISVVDGRLEIKGQHKEEQEEKEEGYIRREYRSSNYQRSFKLPKNINSDQIDAELDKGVLRIRLPKKEIEEKDKTKIDIK
jgi:HSP20 family protein